MKTVFYVLVAMLVAGTGNPLHAAEKFRVIDKGLDGNQRIYLVTCPDGNRSSVIQTFSLPERQQKLPDHNLRVAGDGGAVSARIVQVCIYPHRGEDTCRPAWPVDEAARASCR